jgi:small-conductance mechanosensitive channel
VRQTPDGNLWNSPGGDDRSQREETAADFCVRLGSNSSGLLRWRAGAALPEKKWARVTFRTRQGLRFLTTAILLVGLVSIWFDHPARLTTALGLVSAGIAFALQKVVTAIAAYFILLRGKTFNVGDRTMMGGVRGDVIALDYIQTTIMEMGQPPGEQGDEPSMWVHSRQYTGRIVTVTNDKLFDQPVFNYSREFPYIWEEMQIPISCRDDRARAEEILLEVARKRTVDVSEMSAHELLEMQRRYVLNRSDIKPRVFWRLSDNWIELSLRFIARDHGVRELKDAMTRDILKMLDESHIGIASGTYEVVAMPPIRIQDSPAKNGGNSE